MVTTLPCTLRIRPPQAAFETSVRAWSTLLSSLGVSPVDETVRSTLEQTRGTRTVETLAPAIDNYDEVAAVLQGAGPPWSTMLDENMLGVFEFVADRQVDQSLDD